MENQQPETDDLTGESPVRGTDPDGEDSTTDDTDLTPGTDEHAESWFRLVGGWPVAAVAMAATLFIGAVVFASVALQPYVTDRAESAAKLEVARSAAAAVTTLWTYTPETIDTLADRAGQYLTTEFGGQYRTFVDSVVMPNKRAQMSDDTNVVGVAVESLTGADATALVFTNTTATSPMTQNVPSLKYVAYRLEMKHEESTWRVNKMSTVSFIDLTPKL
ncbi:mammalian cell entry protein [Mycolicibacterium sp. (ex Dasyatis americana)]|nr:mammalian cell entry protein [Mycolicibacterium sp. (ex Dasyatis americana)]